jgi:hypothetical protein
MYYGVVGHGHAWEFKIALGDEYYNQLRVFGMVRHPFDKLISSYFYSRSQSVFQVFEWKGEKNMLKRKVKGFISFVLPRILPLSI